MMQGRYRHDRARRPRRAEHVRIDCVERGPILDTDDERRHLQHVLRPAAGRFDDGEQIGQREPDLLLKGKIGKRLAFQADGQLAGDENEIAIGAPLCVMARGLRRGIRGNLLDGVRRHERLSP